MRWNAIIGPRPKDGYRRACRIWILIFNGSKDVQDAIDQESYWQGGNKNELILCIGVDKSYTVNWTYVISWTKNERFKIDIRDYPVLNKPLDLNEVVAYVGKECKSRFERREFAEFSYLTVSPPTWAIITTWLITIFLNIGIGVFVVMNDYEAY